MILILYLRTFGSTAFYGIMSCSCSGCGGWNCTHTNAPCRYKCTANHNCNNPSTPQLKFCMHTRSKVVGSTPSEFQSDGAEPTATFSSHKSTMNRKSKKAINKYEANRTVPDTGCILSWNILVATNRTNTSHVYDLLSAISGRSR